MIALVPFLALCVLQDDPVVAQPEPLQHTEPPLILHVGHLTGADLFINLRKKMEDRSLDVDTRIEAFETWRTFREASQGSDRISDLVASLELVVDDVDGEPPFEAFAFRDGQAIAVRGTTAQKNLASKVIEGLAGAPRMIMVQTAIYKVKENDLEVLVDGKSANSLTDAQAERLRERLSDAKAELVTAPGLFVMSGQRAEVTVGEETAYVRDFEVGAFGDTMVADPVVDVVFSGHLLNVHSVLVGDRIRVQLEHVSSDLELPIPTKDIPVGASGHEVTVQLPKVNMIKVASKFDVTTKATLVLAASNPAPEEGANAEAVVIIVSVEAESAETERER